MFWKILQLKNGSGLMVHTVVGAHRCKVRDKFYNWLKLFYFKAFNKFVTNMVGALHSHVVCCCFEPMLRLCFHFSRG
jgi:hypothetical protein